ncbi:MAG: hypothetical protein K6F61_07325 [Clostridiales bacterium]|nr:hypothetical protein [Clostridiales bacterium]
MKMIFAKASTERKPAFRQQTVILEDAGRRIVQKTSAHPDAAAHIRSYAENARLLRDSLKNESAVRIAPCELSADGAAEFPYYADPSLASRLALLPPADYLAEILRWKQTLADAFGSRAFENTEEFAALFGKACNLPDERSLTLTNLDMNFDNVFLTGENEYTLIDYEWVFPFPIPLSFVLFRALTADAAFTAFPEEEQLKILEGLGITAEMKARFWEMEYAFQRYVADDEDKLDYYIDPAHTLCASVHLDEIPSLKNQLAEYKEAYDRQQEAISKLDHDFNVYRDAYNEQQPLLQELTAFRDMIRGTRWYRMFYQGKEE